MSERKTICLLRTAPDVSGAEKRWMEFGQMDLQAGSVLLPALLAYLQKQKAVGNFSPCAGGGKCGRCRVRFIKGAPLPTATERTVLVPAELREGTRLSCLTHIGSNAVIDITDLLAQIEQARDAYISAEYELPEAERGRLGENKAKIIAVDLGTTTIAAQLFDPVSQCVLARKTAFNPQRSYGADVVSRMEAALRSAQDAEKLKNQVQQSIGGLMTALAEQANSVREEICAVLTGNTIMIHLALGLSVETLARSPFLPVTLKPEPVYISGRKIHVMPGISAFVGGDITAGLLACDMLSPGTLLLDLGTNAEMVYRGENGVFTATAAAAGSAFEGMTGAYRYGSETVSELAKLLRGGAVDKSGAYVEDDVFSDTLSQKTIRQLQLAKAAVRAGMEILTEGILPKKIYLAGGFGKKVNLQDAMEIGLFPREAQGRIAAVGNTALAGATIYGSRFVGEAENVDLPAFPSAVNLADLPEFQDRFLHFCNFE